MLKIRFSIVLFMALFVNMVICETRNYQTVNTTLCDMKTRIAFSLVFCEKATKCSNQTADQYLAQFRRCVADKNETNQELFETSNKLESDHCIKHIESGVCDIIKDMNDNPDKYVTCLTNFDISQVFATCKATSNDEIIQLEQRIAKIICVDSTKLECQTYEAIEAFKLSKSCIVGKSPRLRHLSINKVDTHECKNKARDILLNAVKGNLLVNIVICLDRHRFKIQANDPIEKCAGF